jgi:hypothetical protein
MALAVGTRLGPHDVIAPLGAGGPAFARACVFQREPRRGHAEDQENMR